MCEGRKDGFTFANLINQVDKDARNQEMDP